MKEADLQQALLVLTQVPPDSSIRLLLQLALAANIPPHMHALLRAKLTCGISLRTLIEHDDLLMALLDADGQISEVEENMLLEAMDHVGLVAPTDQVGSHYVLETLSQHLLTDMAVA